MALYYKYFHLPLKNLSKDDFNDIVAFNDIEMPKYNHSFNFDLQDGFNFLNTQTLVHKSGITGSKSTNKSNGIATN